MSAKKKTVADHNKGDSYSSKDKFVYQEGDLREVPVANPDGFVDILKAAH